ncbi:hypothetical protein BH11BAC7_BH11BAC7_33020 [soil metagenome]
MSTGEGLQDYGMRIYNPAIGKFLSVDPLTKSYPELTPYQFASNQPIWAIDIDGLEKLIVTDVYPSGYMASYILSDEDFMFPIQLDGYNQILGQVETITGMQLGTNDFYAVTRTMDASGSVVNGVHVNKIDPATVTPESPSFFQMAENGLIRCDAACSGNYWSFYNSSLNWEGSDNTITPFGQGMKILGGTVAVILSGGSLLFASGAADVIFASIGIANGTDDITASFYTPGLDGQQTFASSVLGVKPEYVDRFKALFAVTDLGRSAMKSFTGWFEEYEIAQAAERGVDESTYLRSMNAKDWTNVINMYFDAFSATLGGYQSMEPDKTQYAKPLPPLNRPK